MRSSWTLVVGMATLATVTVVRPILTAQTAPDATIARVPNPPLGTDLPSLPGDLRAIPVPGPPNLDEFVKDPAMAASPSARRSSGTCRSAATACRPARAATFELAPIRGRRTS